MEVYPTGHSVISESSSAVRPPQALRIDAERIHREEAPKLGRW
jgi:hypothetical protein